MVRENYRMHGQPSQVEWWCRLVGQGLHHTSLHTLCAHAGSRDTTVSFLLSLHVRDVLARLLYPSFLLLQLQHYNLVQQCIAMPQAMKIPAAKAAVD